MKEKISIVVPIYNSEAFLTDCITSILQQNYDNIELILIDDGSSDQSYIIMKEQEKKHDRIRILRKSNSGVSSTRNIGIEMATGKYIMFVDADDLLPENAICRLVKKINEYKVDIIFGNYNYLFGNKRLLRIPRLQQGVYSIKEIDNIIIDDGTLTGFLLGSACGALYSLDFLKKNNISFEETVKINEDGLFNLQCMCKGAKIYLLDQESVYEYRQWKSNHTYDYRIHVMSFEECDKKLTNIVQDKINPHSVEKQIKLRKITEVFQESVKICETNNYRLAKGLLNTIWTQLVIIKGDNSMYTSINIYKKVLLHLMHKKRYLIFYGLITYIYPLLRRVVRR